MTRRGLSLVELLVVLAIMGLLAGVTALAVPPRRQADLAGRSIERARLTAIRTGQVVELTVDSVGADGPSLLEFLPDGRVLGSGIDPWTGGRDAER